jgi:hypothetical protein
MCPNPSFLLGVCLRRLLQADRNHATGSMTGAIKSGRWRQNPLKGFDPPRTWYTSINGGVNEMKQRGAKAHSHPLLIVPGQWASHLLRT